jgi:hypothetical protein
MSADYPNSGTLFTAKKMFNEKSPHFNGFIEIEKDLLLALIQKSDGEEVKIKIDGWKRKDKEGNHMVSLKVNTYEKKEHFTAAKDPWDN